MSRYVFKTTHFSLNLTENSGKSVTPTCTAEEMDLKYNMSWQQICSDLEAFFVNSDQFSSVWYTEQCFSSAVWFLLYFIIVLLFTAKPVMDWLMTGITCDNFPHRVRKHASCHKNLQSWEFEKQNMQLHQNVIYSVFSLLKYWPAWFTSK